MTSHCTNARVTSAINFPTQHEHASTAQRSILQRSKIKNRTAYPRIVI